MQIPILQDAYDRQVALCNELERIADSLPDRVDPQACRSVAKTLPETMEAVQAAEEKLLFPQVLAKSRHGHQDLIEKLRLQQVADLCSAEEVQQELLLLAGGQPSLAPEALGYLLRGFFDGVRRHVLHSKELLDVLDDASRPPAA
ncbi:MAG TPA: hemerythrin domain-containing protein [Devosia sp.]